MTAGFLFTLGPVIEQLGGRSSDDVELITSLESASPAGLERSAGAALDAAGLDATVEVQDDGATVDGANDDGGLRWVQVVVTPAPGTDPERVRTALGGEVLDRHPLEAAGDDIYGDDLVVHDFRRASLALAIATMVLAATTTAITSSASILDQRPTLRRLRLGGTPVGTLQRARAWQSALPLVVATLGSLATGVGTALLLLSAAGNDRIDTIGPGDLAPMLAVVGVGLALALGAALVTRPLLVAATAGDP